MIYNDVYINKYFFIYIYTKYNYAKFMDSTGYQ